MGDIDYRIFDVEVLNEIEGNELIECTRSNCWLGFASGRFVTEAANFRERS